MFKELKLKTTGLNQKVLEIHRVQDWRRRSKYRLFGEYTWV